MKINAEAKSHRPRVLTVASTSGSPEYAGTCTCGWVTPTNLKDRDEAQQAMHTHVVAALRAAK